RASLQLLGRCPPGCHFTRDAKTSTPPDLAVLLLVLEGEATVHGKERSYELKAPPGPALVFVDSLGDHVPAVQHLAKLPAGPSREVTSERGKKMREVMARFRKSAQSKPAAEVVADLMKSSDVTEKCCALCLLAATDQLDEFGQVLATSTEP